MNVFLLILLSLTALSHLNLVFKGLLKDTLDLVLAVIVVSLWWFFVYKAGIFTLM